MKYFIHIIAMLVFFSGSTFAQKKQPTDKSSKCPGYEYLGSFNNGLAKMKKNKKWGYVDTTCNVVFPPKYNEAENFSDGIARVRIGQKWGLISSNGTEIIKPTFEWIYEFVDGIAKVKIDGDEYYMNKSGQRVK